MRNEIEKLEADLWEAADNLRANSKLTSSDYFMPVLGVIFLRHAANRFEAATRQIEDDQASGRMPKRKVVPADYLRRRALWLPEQARYDRIMRQGATSGADFPALVNAAMTVIEDEFEPLEGVLPKDYGIFETKVLEDLMRLFNSDQIKRATGDVFGRIYEYFLAKFSIQKAHDNGEFFTPSSIVQTIVNVIVVEKKLALMLARNPLRMDYYKRYQEIAADYNREKDRVTVEETFTKLVELANSLDAEQRRAAEEGLTEQELALFDLLFKEDITRAERERVKQASRTLLQSLREVLRPIHDWTQNTATQAEVKVLILDTLWQSLPRPPFTEEETELVANRIYDHVWQQSASGLDLEAA